WLATAFEGLRRFVTATAPHLHCFIGDAPGGFCRPHLAHRSLDPQIAFFAIDERAGQEGHCFHGKNVARHFGDLTGNRLMLADRTWPLDTFARPLAADFEKSF